MARLLSNVITILIKKNMHHKELTLLKVEVDIKNYYINLILYLFTFIKKQSNKLSNRQ